MRTKCLLLGVLPLWLLGCSTTSHSSAHRDPETVLVTYHVRTGKEAEFRALLSRAWETYRREQLVFSEPHVVVQDTEGAGKPRFVEVFPGSAAPSLNTLLRV